MDFRYHHRFQLCRSRLTKVWIRVENFRAREIYYFNIFLISSISPANCSNYNNWIPWRCNRKFTVTVQLNFLIKRNLVTEGNEFRIIIKLNSILWLVLISQSTTIPIPLFCPTVFVFFVFFFLFLSNANWILNCNELYEKIMSSHINIKICDPNTFTWVLWWLNKLSSSKFMLYKICGENFKEIRLCLRKKGRTSLMFPGNETRLLEFMDKDAELAKFLISAPFFRRMLFKKTKYFPQNTETK